MPLSRRAPTASRDKFVPQRIVSGGQTGVDRAALEVAIALGIEHGGWCPRGRVAEDGTVPSRYQLVENDSRDYRVRTEMNVIDSDATLILYEAPMGAGTRLTKKMCHLHERPLLALRIDRELPGVIADWLLETRPKTLNIAGPRESGAPGIEERAMQFLLQALT